MARMDLVPGINSTESKSLTYIISLMEIIHRSIRASPQSIPSGL